jgi:hypothetical protein
MWKVPMHKPALADRRRELVSRCAEQRSSLAGDLQALRPSAALGHPLAGYVVGHKKLVLGALGAVLGLALTRRKRLAGLLGSAMSAWKMAQGALAMLARLRT